MLSGAVPSRLLPGCSPEATEQPEDWEQDRGREPGADKPPQHREDLPVSRGGQSRSNGGRNGYRFVSMSSRVRIGAETTPLLRKSAALGRKVRI